MTDKRGLLGVFAASFVITALWAIGMPLFSGPDEPAHVIKAAGVVRGDLDGSPVETGAPGARTMNVSPKLASAHHVGCFAYKPNVPADCFEYGEMTHLYVDKPVRTTAGRHPPFYYAAVGAPTLFSIDSAGIYAVRFLSAFVAAAFLTASWMFLGSTSRPLVARLGLAVAVTPMVFAIGGTVNPSAWEIGAAVLFWSAGLVVTSGKTSGSTIHALGISAVALSLSRQLGPLWLVLIGIALAVMCDRRELAKFARNTSARIWMGITGVSVLAQSAWVATVGTLETAGGSSDVSGLPGISIFRESAGRQGDNFYEMIGVFGWLDATSPEWTYFVWTAAAIGLAVAGIATGTRREAAVIVLIAIATWAIPIAGELKAAREVGFYWQGRYGLPLAVGVPLVAAWILSRKVTIDGKGRLAIGVALGTAQFLAFGQALRRFAAGARSDELLFWQGATWTPPIPIVLCLIAMAAALTIWYWLLLGREPSQTPAALKGVST